MDAKNLYIEYQQVSEQLKKVQEFLEKTTENLAQVSELIAALDEFSSLAKGSRIFAPIANGIFIDATLNDTSTVRMNVGGKIVVKKPVSEAKELLGKQQAELEALRERAEQDSTKMMARLKMIEASVEKE